MHIDQFIKKNYWLSKEGHTFKIKSPFQKFPILTKIWLHINVSVLCNCCRWIYCHYECSYRKIVVMVAAMTWLEWTVNNHLHTNFTSRWICVECLLVNMDDTSTESVGGQVLKYLLESSRMYLMCSLLA